MHSKHIYLKIEKLRDYNPVAPDPHDHERGPVDCMRTMGHEDAMIPPSEVARRTFDALIYREYLDANFTMPKDTPLIAADINEPRASRRIPGTVIYAQPGERLYVHVLNGDDQPHSLHVHSLHYGIDSDGSWPFGVHRDDGSRSDAICPGHQWCYIFAVDENTIGAWPFHDHHMEISAMANRGLFGGIVVRDPGCEKPDHEVPIVFHRLAAETGRPLFDSGTLRPGDPDFSHQFDAEGTYEYYCKIHPGMRGKTVRVTAAGSLTVTVNILDTPPRYELDDVVTIRVGGTVTWHHGGTQDHTVSDASSATLESLAINGRTFVGNTPTIVADSGQRIRWCVFNLDLWHDVA